MYQGIAFPDIRLKFASLTEKLIAYASDSSPSGMASVPWNFRRPLKLMGFFWREVYIVPPVSSRN
jgi:hypothetical protein